MEEKAKEVRDKIDAILKESGYALQVQQVINIVKIPEEKND